MVGIDLVSIKRIEKFYEKFGIRAYEKFLRPEEIALIKSPKTAAGFWCIKEAISKAIGCGISELCSFKDIWISKDKFGKPYAKLSKHLIDKFNITNIQISISHENDFAIGIAFIQGNFKQKELSF